MSVSTTSSTASTSASSSTIPLTRPLYTAADYNHFAMQRREPGIGYMARLDYSPSACTCGPQSSESSPPIPTYDEAVASAPIATEKRPNYDSDPPLKAVRQISHKLANKLDNILFLPTEAYGPTSGIKPVDAVFTVTETVANEHRAPKRKSFFKKIALR